MKSPKARVQYNKGKGKGAAFLIALIGHEGDECVTWPYSTDRRIGRGTLGYNGRLYWAHRLMCILAHGEPPDPKLDTAHSCGNGNKGCVNPNHLSWQTRQKNCIDGVAHGTQYRPEVGRRDKLGDRRQELISRKGQQTVVATAKEFGVSASLVIYYWGGKDRWPSHQR